MDSTAVKSAEAATAARGAARVGPILREITIGGLAALIAGTLIGGIGGRVVMRLAALLVPGATGLSTENGNIIGAITLEGTLVVFLFGGLLAGVVAATVWVITRPWLPASLGDRVLYSIPLVLAVGVPFVIEAGNPDFAVLGFHPLVVGALVLLVAVVGPAVALLDGWLGRRLPLAGPSNRLAIAVYATVTLLGLLLTFAFTIPVLMQIVSPLVIIALLVVGLSTLFAWGYRAAGQPQPVWPAPVVRSALVVAIVVGLLAASIEIAGALGRA